MHARGFTLLELLLVLALLGVVLGLALLAVGSSPGHQVEKEQQRLSAILQMAADEAMLQGVELGLAVSQSGYGVRFRDPEDQRWRPYLAPSMQPHELRDVRISLRVEGEGVVLPERLGQERGPAILLLSSGEITPFELTLSSLEGQFQRRLWSDGVNLLQLPEGT